MEFAIGVLLGAAIIVAVVAFAIRNPSKPLDRRGSDHGGWNNTNGSSKGF